jgi:N-methylhydantoinase B/oxoprolinase/acetone carboxylase alpha subunit
MAEGSGSAVAGGGAKTRAEELHGTHGKVDPVTLAVIGGSFVAAGHEMGHSIKRLAFSPGAQQVEDIGGGLFTVKGEEICESDTSPMHIGSIPAYIEGFMRRLEGDINEGDVIIHNNPYQGASHAPDLLVAVPIFWEDEHVAWAAATTHLTDVGGVFPGIAIDVFDVFAEAKIYDSIKLYDRGVRNEMIWRFFLDNTRTPTYVEGDTEAMIATCRLGERRLHEMLGKYGKDTVMQCVEEWLDYSERMMRAEIEKIPDGSWEAEGWLDDDGKNRDQPLKVKVKITIEGSNVIADLTGSQENSLTGFNCPYGGSTLPGFYTIARSIFLDQAVFADAAIPQNHGLFRPVTVIAPVGTIFNPAFPRSAGPRACLICTAGDTAMKALAEVVPDKISAGTSTLSVAVYAGFLEEKQEYWSHYDIIEGSYGGRLGKDGIDAVDTLIINSRNVPIEEVDMLFPMRTERYELRSDPPAAGQWRGGVASVRESRFLVDTVMTSEAEGTYEAPWGIFGGKEGTPLRVTKTLADGTEENLHSKVTNLPMAAGSTIRWEQASGGGYGDPLKREPEAVLRDLRDEFITVEIARDDYGVVIDPATLTVDLDATEKLRAERG